MRTISLMFLACILLTACDSSQEISKVEPPPVPVLAVLPVVKDVPVYVESLGTLSPSIFMEIYPQVDGMVAEVLTKEGEWVQRGTPLFKIDPKPYSIKVQETEAQLAIDRATAQAAQKKLERFRKLAQKDLVAQTEWDELEMQVETALASLELDKARLSATALDLERCTLVSPVEGRIGKIDVHPGLLVAAGQAEALASISKMDPLIVEFTVTEKEFPKIPRDKIAFEVQPFSSSEAPKTGFITFLDNHFDHKTGLLLVRGQISNPDYTLRPGQWIKVKVPIAITPNAKLIPQKSIRYNQEGPYIYVVQPDMTVGFRQVLLGDEQGTDVIVLEGLNPSEPIITDGHLRLSPGLKVEVKS